MSDVAVQVRWEGGLRFQAMGRAEVPLLVDGDGAVGPTPMESLLMGLAGCMAIDVVDILGKMRVPVDGLVVDAEGDRREEAPRHYTAVRLVYRLSGVPAGDRAKLQRAVDLSRDKYCSVLHSIRPDVDLTIRIEAD